MTPEPRTENVNRRAGTAVFMTVLTALAACAGLVATSCAGSQDAKQPGVMTATEFCLVDSAGVTRARLMMDRGNPILRFFGEKGEFRAAIGLQEYGPSLFFARANGRPGTSIGVGGHGPAMAFGDTAGHPRIMVLIDDSTGGMPTIALRDTTGHTVWAAPEPVRK
jgi:hypothetical protein